MDRYELILHVIICGMNPEGVMNAMLDSTDHRQGSIRNCRKFRFVANVVIWNSKSILVASQRFL